MTSRETFVKNLIARSSSDSLLLRIGAEERLLAFQALLVSVYSILYLGAHETYKWQRE